MGAVAAAEIISHIGARPETDLKALVAGKLAWPPDDSELQTEARPDPGHGGVKDHGQRASGGKSGPEIPAPL